MAVDQQVGHIVANIAAEGQDLLDVRFLRQHNARSGFDCVVKTQRRAPAPIKGREGCRIWPFRVKNG